ncbi:hypothetical protein IW261DRAFT_1412905 [Armillaria novae-zelandiae]|uniref:Uncharacterized protein n=1 Tax=Armillaria novae-zelandiae TaxID=153914 RepID=A0AA39PUF3_9AGAR|nr:hypothetical protein IW261DRAFT_1412905 [Armillaria novae-zelandiae]
MVKVSVQKAFYAEINDPRHRDVLIQWEPFRSSCVHKDLVVLSTGRMPGPSGVMEVLVRRPDLRREQSPKWILSQRVRTDDLLYLIESPGVYVEQCVGCECHAANAKSNPGECKRKLRALGRVKKMPSSIMKKRRQGNAVELLAQCLPGDIIQTAEGVWSQDVGTSVGFPLEDNVRVEGDYRSTSVQVSGRSVGDGEGSRACLEDFEGSAGSVEYGVDSGAEFEKARLPDRYTDRTFDPKCKIAKRPDTHYAVVTLENTKSRRFYTTSALQKSVSGWVTQARYHR